MATTDPLTGRLQRYTELAESLGLDLKPIADCETIPGVPDKISRDAYVVLLASIGLQANALQSLEFRHNGIYATVIAQDKDGRSKIVYGTDTPELATHQVFIEVID